MVFIRILFANTQHNTKKQKRNKARHVKWRTAQHLCATRSFYPYFHNVSETRWLRYMSRDAAFGNVTLCIRSRILPSKGSRKVIILACLLMGFYVYSFSFGSKRSGSLMFFACAALWDGEKFISLGHNTTQRKRKYIGSCIAREAETKDERENENTQINSYVLCGFVESEEGLSMRIASAS